MPAPTGQPTTLVETASRDPSRVSVPRLLEVLLLLAALPTVAAFVLPPSLLFPALWLQGLICLAILRRDPAFERAWLWNFAGVRAAMPGILLRLAIAGVAATAVLAAFEPDRLLAFPRERPQIYALVMLFYPLLSVFPQELAYRRYAARRLGPLALGPRGWLITGIIFGYAHIVMHNWIAVALSTVGGIIFARTLEKHRSLAAACIEHALHGCMLFTIGWGWYFYMGAGR